MKIPISEILLGDLLLDDEAIAECMAPETTAARVQELIYEAVPKSNADKITLAIRNGMAKHKPRPKNLGATVLKRRNND